MSDEVCEESRVASIEDEVILPTNHLEIAISTTTLSNTIIVPVMDKDLNDGNNTYSASPSPTISATTVPEKVAKTSPSPQTRSRATSPTSQSSVHSKARSQIGSNTTTTTTNRSTKADSPSRITRSYANKQKRKDTGYVIEVVYDDPNDLLVEPPRQRLRKNGDTMGDILFYGDDIMFGNNTPYPEALRERLTRRGLRLVINALPGRTLAVNDEASALELLGDGENYASLTKGEFYNGTHHFGTVFSSHSPLYVVLGLGLNDLKVNLRKIVENEVDVNAAYLAEKMSELIAHVKTLMTGHCHDGKLKIIVAIPTPIRLTKYTEELGFDQKSVEISNQLARAFVSLKLIDGVVVIQPPVYTATNWTNGFYPSTLTMANNMADVMWNVLEAELPRMLQTRQQHR